MKATMKPNVYRFTHPQLGPLWVAHCVECGSKVATPDWGTALAVANQMAARHAGPAVVIGAALAAIRDKLNGGGS